MTRALPADLRATVVTHSPTVATALAGHLAIEVYLLGGRLFRHSMVACGAAAVEAAQVVHADLFLVGVTGVLPLGAVAGGDHRRVGTGRDRAAADRRGRTGDPRLGVPRMTVRRTPAIDGRFMLAPIIVARFRSNKGCARG